MYGTCTNNQEVFLLIIRLMLCARVFFYVSSAFVLARSVKLSGSPPSLQTGHNDSLDDRPFTPLIEGRSIAGPFQCGNLRNAPGVCRRDALALGLWGVTAEPSSTGTDACGGKTEFFTRLYIEGEGEGDGPEVSLGLFGSVQGIPESSNATKDITLYADSVFKKIEQDATNRPSRITQALQDVLARLVYLVGKTAKANFAAALLAHDVVNDDVYLVKMGRLPVLVKYSDKDSLQPIQSAKDIDEPSEILRTALESAGFDYTKRALSTTHVRMQYYAPKEQRSVTTPVAPTTRKHHTAVTTSRPSALPHEPSVRRADESSTELEALRSTTATPDEASHSNTQPSLTTGKMLTREDALRCMTDSDSTALSLSHPTSPTLESSTSHAVTCGGGKRSKGWLSGVVSSFYKNLSPALWTNPPAKNVSAALVQVDFKMNMQGNATDYDMVFSTGVTMSEPAWQHLGGEIWNVISALPQMTRIRSASRSIDYVVLGNPELVYPYWKRAHLSVYKHRIRECTTKCLSPPAYHFAKWAANSDTKLPSSLVEALGVVENEALELGLADMYRDVTRRSKSWDDMANVMQKASQDAAQLFMSELPVDLPAAMVVKFAPIQTRKLGYLQS